MRFGNDQLEASSEMTNYLSNWTGSSLLKRQVGIVERDRLQASHNYIEYFQINGYSKEIEMNEKSKKYTSVLMLFLGSLLAGFSMGRRLAPLGLCSSSSMH